MTVCNMSIEAGAKAGLIAPDDTTFDYLKGRPNAPTGAAWDEAVLEWRTLVSDVDVSFDKSVDIDATKLEPHVTWGTNPAHVIPISAPIPGPDSYDDPVEAGTAERALEYMGLTAGSKLSDVAIDTVFIGSCTNSRIELSLIHI